MISNDWSIEFAELGARREQETKFTPKNNQILCELLWKRTEKSEMDEGGVKCQRDLRYMRQRRKKKSKVPKKEMNSCETEQEQEHE